MGIFILFVFVCVFQRGSEFIDGVALEEYADEQDDFAQEREIEACIKAVDVDCDGKIGKWTTAHILLPVILQFYRKNSLGV